jgi:hypothetical protein
MLARRRLKAREELCDAAVGDPSHGATLMNWLERNLLNNDRLSWSLNIAHVVTFDTGLLAGVGKPPPKYAPNRVDLESAIARGRALAKVSFS